MKIFYVIILFAFLSYGKVLSQDIPTLVKQAYALVDDEKYKEALTVLRDIDERYIDNLEDSCAMMFYYEKGSCLYFLDRFEEAIPYLNKALLRMEKLPHKDCIYLELIYGIGSCYNNLNQYVDAEKYFRRVILRGNLQGLKCAITTQTLSELTEVYNKLGYTKLAKECAIKIDAQVNDLPEDSWSNRVEGLLDLANSYEVQGRLNDEIDTYHKILNIIESNEGKHNEKYLTYSGILFYRLFVNNLIEDAILVLQDMIANGKLNKKHNIYVCNAYENYLEIMAKRNDTVAVEKKLPEAIRYLKLTKEYDWKNHNLYDRIGNAFVEAGNLVKGAKYLEMPWDGKLANNIRSLGNLGICYFNSNPTKALSYYLKAESLINDSTNNLTKKILYSDIHSLYSNLQKYDDAVKYAQMAAPYIKDIDGFDKYASHLIYWALDCNNCNNLEKSQQLFDEVNILFPSISEKTKVRYYSEYGFFLLKNKNYEMAVSNLSSGINLCKKTLGDNHIWLITLYHNLGRAFMLQQDFANALNYLKTSKDLQIKLNGYAMQRTIDYIKECEAK